MSSRRHSPMTPLTDLRAADAIDALIERCLQRRSGGLGADRPAALAQGVQRRLQVRRQARRGRRSDAGHLPQDLQVARHVRPARELPDVADQRQPQPLHRSLPQRPQGARDDRPRRRRRASCRRSSREPGPMAALEQRDRVDAAAAGAGGAADDAAHGGAAARHPGAVVPGDRRPAAACRKAPSSRASTAAGPSWRGRSASCAANDYSPTRTPRDGRPRTGAY